MAKREQFSVKNQIK